MPIPSPNKGESQNDFISRCMSAIGGEYKDKKQAVAICASKFRDRKKQSMEPIKVIYSFPIESVVQEAVNNKNDFLIRGIAITETTTRNGHKFIAEELIKSVNTLKNKPLLKDHENKVDNVIGRVTDNVHFDNASKSIKFEARILDKSIQEKVKEGLLQSVSVGAYVKELETVESTKETILRGIDFVELSLVAVPADPNASFASAIAEAFHNHDSQESIKEEKMEEVQEAPKPVEVKPSISIEDFNKIKEELESYKKREERTKLEAEIRTKVKAELEAELKKAEPVKVSEEMKPKAQIVKDTITTEEGSKFKVFGYDAETGDMPGIAVSYSMYPQLAPKLKVR